MDSSLQNKSAAPGSEPDVSRRAVFVTTHWSMVLKAGRNDTTQARDSLAKLCKTYWYPLYSYVRRRGYSSEDAQDLTQAFFEKFLELQSLASADPDRGRFRSFLLTAMNNFLAGEWKKNRALKRGGGQEVLSLDLAAAEQRYDLEPADHTTPDKAFDKQWAMTLLAKVLDQLEAEYRQDGKAEVFDTLKQTLMGTRETQPYAVLATTLGINEGAVRVTVHRLRKRYRELLEAEIGNTVNSPEEAKEELRHLSRALTSS